MKVKFARHPKGVSHEVKLVRNQQGFIQEFLGQQIWSEPWIFNSILIKLSHILPNQYISENISVILLGGVNYSVILILSWNLRHQLIYLQHHKRTERPRRLWSFQYLHYFYRIYQVIRHITYCIAQYLFQTVHIRLYLTANLAPKLIKCQTGT